jgi:hypothetical protein
MKISIRTIVTIYARDLQKKKKKHYMNAVITDRQAHRKILHF